MNAVETLRIKAPKDPSRSLRINRGDFDPRRHTLWQDQHLPWEPRHLEGMDREQLTSLSRQLGLKPDLRQRSERLRETILAHLRLQES